MANGEVELTLTAFSNAGCNEDGTDVMTLSIEHNMDQPGLPDGPVVVDLNSGLISEYTIDEVAYATSYQWYLTPTEAGSISGTGTTGTVTWHANYYGLVAQVSVEALNESCPPVLSDALDINVGYVGIENNAGSNMDIKNYTKSIRWKIHFVY